MSRVNCHSAWVSMFQHIWVLPVGLVRFVYIGKAKLNFLDHENDELY